MRVRRFAFFALLSLSLMCCLCSCSEKDSVAGCWKDINEDYYVDFNESGFFRESEYNISQQYSYSGKDLQYYTAAGDLIYVEPEWTFKGNLRVYIGGKYRELKPVEHVASMFNWGDLGTFKVRKAGDSYQLKSTCGLQSELYIGDANSYWYYISTGAVSTDDGLHGLVAISDNYRDYVLYHESGEVAELLRASPYGVYLGAVPMLNDGTLYVEQNYANQALGQSRGYLLDGIVMYAQGGITYTFTTDSRCVKYIPSGGILEYSYYISSEGLLALIPVGGVLASDYMYYDAEQNTIYRLVYQENSWYDYVSEITATISAESEDPVDWTVPASLTAPLDRRDVLEKTCAVSSDAEYSFVGEIDLDYTSWCLQYREDYMLQLQTNEALRKEYEASVKSEQERIRDQMLAEQKERERLKAVMDARVEAEIANGTYISAVVPDSTTSITDTFDDLSWLDNFLSSFDNQPSYDQDANSSGPVVNTDGDNPADTPVSAASTDPLNTEEGNPDTEVSQYDPAFYVDFVCTCVNCHVQALPVELDTNDVLLVDASVIEPGTYLSIEGYGMVVARASGGYTSGQTAVLYSNNHNAVNRFSSGTYNVYKVVG